MARKPLPVVCSSRVGVEQERRPANALNIEYMTPSPRCMNKLPDHWFGAGRSAVRWLGSGGSPLVFGKCGGHCPRFSEQPERHEGASAATPCSNL